MKIVVVDQNLIDALDIVSGMIADRAPDQVSKENTHRAGYGNAMINMIGNLSFMKYRVRKGKL